MTRNARSAMRRQATRASHGDHRCAKLWAAARILQVFTASSLCAVAEYPNKASAQAYLNKLRHAGYFRTQRDGNREAVWTLIRNSGPATPALIRNRSAVYDFNTDMEHALT